MKLGSRLCERRKGKGYTLRELAAKVDVGFAYLCKIETGKLDADDNELLIPAEHIPESIRRRVMERPKAFTMLAALGGSRPGSSAESSE